MLFLNPPLLAGLAAALVPLVVHLLNRSRYRNVDWGAMMFLSVVEPRADHAARVKQWGLLAIRSGIVGLLAFALARPVFYPRAEPPRRAGRTAAVILLDRSSSMLLNDNGRPRIDLARDAVYQLLSPGFARGDDLWLVPLGDGDATPIYATDPQDMARRVRETPTPSGQADIAAGLDTALALLSRSRAPNHEIYVVSDRQAVSWAKVDDGFERRWRDETSVGLKPLLTLVPVGTDEAGNVAVTSVAPVTDRLPANQASDVHVTVRNFGSVPHAGVTLALSLLTPAGRTVPVRSAAVKLPALAEITQTIPVTFGDSGCYVLTATVDAQGVTTDKSLSHSVDVEPPLRALIVDGDAREGGFQSASEFLRAALTPYRDAKRDLFSIDVVHPDTWDFADLHAYAVVVLANVPALSEAQARACEQFVCDGGGAVVSPGDQTRIEQYDTQVQWLPARLSPAAPEGDAAPTDISPPASGPGAKLFASGRSEPGGVAVRRYFGAVPKPDASTLASFGNGKPFVIAAALGRGRVVLLATPVDSDWNALPLTPLFLPFAQSLIAYAGAGASQWRETQWNAVVGEPLHARFESPVDPRNVRLEGPSPATRAPGPLAVATLPEATEATSARTTLPGIYRLSTRAGAPDPAAIRFSVRTPSAETDLTSLTGERCAHLAEALAARWADPDAKPLPAMQGAARAGWALWLPCVGAVIGLCAFELAAARWWTGGNV